MPGWIIPMSGDPPAPPFAQLPPTGRLLLGRNRDDLNRLISTDRDRHLMTVAPAGSGKSTSVLVPNLLRYRGSAVVVDPKGELAAVTARARLEMGQTVYFLNPFGLHGLASHQLNPLDWINPEGPGFFSEADTIAQGIVVPSSKQDDGHWDREARALIRGLVMHVATSPAPQDRHIGRIRQLLLDDDLHGLLEAMRNNLAAQGRVGREANRMLQKAEREFSAVLSTAHGHTDFLEDPRMVETLRRSDLDPADLKRGGVTIYLMLPANHLEAKRPWLRLVLAQLLYALQEDAARPDLPVTFFLDELAALGRLDLLLQAYGLARGYGIRMWSFWQDLSQPKRIYGEGWRTIQANSGVQQFFAVTDYDTAKLVSDLCGVSTSIKRSANLGTSIGPERENESDGVAIDSIARPLATSDEVRTMERGYQLLFVPGVQPIVSKQLSYLQDREFEGLSDPNPLHDG